MQSFSLFTWLAQASILVKLIVLVLLLMSMVAWSLFFFKYRFFQKIQKDNALLSTQLQSPDWDFNALRQTISGMPHHLAQSLMIKNAYDASLHPAQTQHIALNLALDHAIDQTIDESEKHLGHISSIASMAPYVGLLGTVMGIMHTFLQLGQELSIQKIMPSIAESLIVTGLGLLVAIPAAFSYNFFQYKIERLMAQLSILKSKILYALLSNQES